jgi:hypothetical protein
MAATAAAAAAAEDEEEARLRTGAVIAAGSEAMSVGEMFVAAWRQRAPQADSVSGVSGFISCRDATSSKAWKNGEKAGLKRPRTASAWER